MNPFLLSPRSGLQSYLHFSSPGGSHKSERTRYSTSCRVGVNAKGTMELGKLERGSKGLWGAW